MHAKFGVLWSACGSLLLFSYLLLIELLAALAFHHSPKTATWIMDFQPHYEQEYHPANR